MIEYNARIDYNNLPEKWRDYLFDISCEELSHADYYVEKTYVLGTHKNFDLWLKRNNLPAHISVPPP